MQYREKSKIIDAFQWHGEHNLDDLQKWVESFDSDEFLTYFDHGKRLMFIPEDLHVDEIVIVNSTDWIIRGHSGGYYLSTNLAFEDMYELNDAKARFINAQ